MQKGVSLNFLSKCLYHHIQVSSLYQVMPLPTTTTTTTTLCNFHIVINASDDPSCKGKPLAITVRGRYCSHGKLSPSKMGL